MTRLLGFFLRIMLAPVVIVITLIQVVLAFILILSTHVLSVIASLMLNFAIIVMCTSLILIVHGRNGSEIKYKHKQQRYEKDG